MDKGVHGHFCSEGMRRWPHCCFPVLCSQAGFTWPVVSASLTRASVSTRLDPEASARVTVPRWTGPRGRASAPSSSPSWRKSSISTSTWRGPGAWRSPAPYSSARRRWKFGFRTDAWSRRNYRGTGCSQARGRRHRAHAPTRWTPASLPDGPRPNTCPWTPELRGGRVTRYAREGACLQMLWLPFLHRFQSGVTSICLPRWIRSAKKHNGRFVMQEQIKTICHPPSASDFCWFEY